MDAGAAGAAATVDEDDDGAAEASAGADDDGDEVAGAVVALWAAAITAAELVLERSPELAATISDCAGGLAALGVDSASERRSASP